MRPAKTMTDIVSEVGAEHQRQVQELTQRNFELSKQVEALTIRNQRLEDLPKIAKRFIDAKLNGSYTFSKWTDLVNHVRSLETNQIKCEPCGGIGGLWDAECSICNGSGVVNHVRSLEESGEVTE